MYSMNIVLICRDARVLAEVHREILNNSATVDAEFADVSSVFEALESKADESRLFIVHVGSSSDLLQLKRLSGTFVGRPIIALVDASRDVSLAVKAMRSGAMQVILLPIERADFGAALDCVAAQCGLAPGRAKTIAVAGATGGCGTTTIAVNLAYELACMKHVKCILIELSLRMGVLASHLDVQPRCTTSDLLYDDRLDSDILNHGLTLIVENFSILPGPYQTIEPGIIKAENVLKLIELAGHLAEVVILDVPCTFDEFYFQALSTADTVILVTQQQVSSIRGAQMVCEALPDVSMRVVVNRYDPKLTGLTADRLRTRLRCPELTTIANDPAVGAAVDHGRALRLQSSGSRALADIRKLMEGLVPKELLSKKHTEPTILGRISSAFFSKAKV